MPGKRITDQQVNKYKQLRRKHSQEAAAAKAGISVSSARRIEAAEACPRSGRRGSWRTRADPLGAVWDSRSRAAAARAAPALIAVTLLEELQRRHPGRSTTRCCARCSAACASGAPCTAPSARSSSRRSIRRGGSALSDFTVADELGVSIAGVAFPHRLYQFALAHWGWRHARVVRGGESFQALASGLQEALWMAGGVPEEHRTDSLSAAFNNLAEQRGADPALRRAVRALRHAREPQQPGPEPRERLDRIAPRQLKRRWIRRCCCAARASLPTLRSLRAVRRRDRAPAQCALRSSLGSRARPTAAAAGAAHAPTTRRLDARVSKYGIFTAKSALYSVPSRLAGHRLKVRLYSAHLEAGSAA